MSQCKFFAKGFCSRGTSCRFTHDTTVSPSASIPTPQDFRAETDWRARTLNSGVPNSGQFKPECRYYAQGICAKGVACPFLHSDQTSSTGVVGLDSGIGSSVKDGRSEINCHFFLQGNCAKGQECPFAHSGQPLLTGTDDLGIESENLNNCSRELCGALTLFEAGARVSKVSLSSDFSAVRINGFDLDTISESVVKILAELGFNVPVTGVRTLSQEGLRGMSADVRVEDPTFASKLCNKLSHDRGAQKKYPQLQAVLVTTNILSQSTAQRVECRNVSCSWHKPSRLAWLKFGTQQTAKRVQEAFNSRLYKVGGGQVFCDEPIRSISGRRPFNTLEYTIRMKDLGPQITKTEISSAIIESRYRPRNIELGHPTYRANNMTVDRHIKAQFSRYGALEAWEVSQDSSPRRVKATARFRHEADAIEAARFLNDKALDVLGDGKISAQLIHSAKFKLATNIYDAVSPVIDSERQIWAQQHVKCKPYRNTDPAQRYTVIRIFGENAKEVAKAKASLEGLLAGVIAMDGNDPIWSASFNNGSKSKELKQIHQDFGILVVRDKKRSRLLLYGSSKNQERAQRALCDIRKSDSCKVHVLELGQEMFKNALNGGFQEILSALGKDVVSMDVASTPKKLFVTGSHDDYQLALRVLNNQRTDKPSVLKTDNDCVVCWTEADNPIRTQCDHIYCHECFENSCSANASGEGEFLIRCHGDSGACQVVFTLSELQEHLSSTAFEDTLQSSFTSYIRRRPHIFRYCPTPNCEQVYRTDLTAKIYKCPRCISAICTSCHVSHDNQTCAEYEDEKSGGNKAFEKLKKEKGYKDCPDCNTTMEKTEGCNHMVCSGCRIHICWVCLKTFTQSGRCYEHMNKEHGGIGLDNLFYNDWE